MKYDKNVKREITKIALLEIVTLFGYVLVTMLIICGVFFSIKGIHKLMNLFSNDYICLAIVEGIISFLIVLVTFIVHRVNGKQMHSYLNFITAQIVHPICYFILFVATSMFLRFLINPFEMTSVTNDARYFIFFVTMFVTGVVQYLCVILDPIDCYVESLIQIADEMQQLKDLPEEHLKELQSTVEVMQDTIRQYKEKLDES